jgi:hypothetical protein
MAGFGRDAVAEVGFGFFASSEEEDFTMATEKGGEVGSATLAGFGKAAGSLVGR